MMAQFEKGNGFNGAVKYANKVCDKHATILSHRGVNVTSHSALVNSFEIQRMMIPSVKDFVGHLILSFSPRDRHRMTSELMNQIALEYMHMMGLDNTQYAVFRHRDQPHDHVHVIYNRVDDDGNPITNDTNYRKSIAVTKMLTRKYKLTWGEGKEHVRRERLKGKDKSKYAIYDAVKAALRYCKTVEQLRSELACRGIDIRLATDNSGLIKGVSFSDGKCSFGGKRIDKSLSWNKIYLQLEQNRLARLAPTMPQVHHERPTNDSTPSYKPSDNKPTTPEKESAVAITDTSETDGNGSNAVEAVIDILLPPQAVNVGTGSGSSNNSTKTESDIEREKEERNNRPRRRR